MGWDAYTVPDKISKKAKKAFEQASDDVVKLVGTADGGLHRAYLDLSDTRNALYEMTNMDTWREDWTIIETRKAYELCREYIETHELDNDMAFCYYSAFKFLAVYCQFNYGVSFSW